MSSALAYLATQQVFHNDIKPFNIAYSPNRGAVLMDFGIASMDEGEKAGGTSWYLPPEYLEGGIRGSSGDVWALGITMLFVLGKIDLPEMMKDWRAVRKGRRMRAWFEFIAQTRAQLNHGDKVEHLVHQMLERDPLLRIKAADIESALPEKSE
ncbi:serine threonine kinase [Trichoderma cornu-damae]|uniref:Serine threonine kinase n=1 Tax=Trichoderma cornu-damae TaxID=654480 RepID=A0A9P8QRT7_9HYPO|nr:serine threonine kinase [Trichoderma cornu-damae]